MAGREDIIAATALSDVRTNDIHHQRLETILAQLLDTASHS
jgi:hypothetical protein